MQTRSSSRLVSDQSFNLTSPTNPNPKGRNRRHSKQRVENSNLEEHSPPVVTMADQCTMAQLLQAPTEGYEDAIVVLAINADNFKLKHGLLTLVQNKQFYGHDKEDPHAHIRYFNKITSTLKFPNVPNTSIKFMLFLFSLESAARIWLEKEPPRSILTWDDLVLKFINHEAWDRFKDLLRAYPYHVSTNASTSGVSPDVAELKDMVKALLLDKKGQNQSPAPVKVVEESCVTCGGVHSYRKFPPTDGTFIMTIFKNLCLKPPQLITTKEIPVIAPAYQDPAFQTQGVLKVDFSAYVKANDAAMKNMQTQGTLPSNTIANPKSDLKAITTRSGVSYDGPQILPPVVENELEATKDTLNPTNNENIKDVQPQAVQSKPVTSEPAIALIFKDMSFEISFADALILMPKFALTLKALIENKEKLSEMARTPLNEHCYVVLLKNLPEKLGDPGRFLIPCDFSGMVECLALADLGASINLMPFSVWKRLSLPDLTPTCMTLELADHSISHPVGVAEDVYVKVGSFHFSANFVVVDFDADPRVHLILGRSFLKTGRALIDVFKGELTLRVGKEAITFNLDQTSRYSANYSDMMAKRIDVIDMACEEYSHEVLGFFDTIWSGNPTLYYDQIVSATSLTLTLFENNDFLLEKGDILLLEAFLNNDPSSPPPNQRNYLPKVPKELKIYKAKTNKSSVDEPLVVELKALPPHLEYAFLEGNDKLPVIIAKDLSVEEKAALITEKTTFTCPYGTFAYRRMPFGLYNALGTFQRNSFQSCLSHLEKMLKRCEDTNLCLNWEKSHFMVKEGIVLGHKIFKQGIEVDKAKVDVISKLPHPTTVKGIRSFLGHAGFYRRFIKDFSKIARPMTRLLEKDTSFIFSQECVDAFQSLKRKLTEAPILIAPDWDMPFELMCDASDFAIGAVLGQRQDKHFKPIHYASKTMTEAKSNYTTTEKEMLAVVYAFEKFRSYLILNKSIVYTDHSALKYLFAKKDSRRDCSDGFYFSRNSLSK
nr:reverse transcriptase domain-containing protein [Tanacetum cinerariifolium]